jgi:hypothetical protein
MEGRDVNKRHFEVGEKERACENARAVSVYTSRRQTACARMIELE